MPTPEYVFDENGNKLTLKSPDLTTYQLTVLDGGEVCAGGVPISGRSIIVKSSDQSVISSTTMQDDDELFKDVLNGETWLFNAVLFAHEGGTNPNIKIRMGAVSGLTGPIEYVYHSEDGSEADTLSDFIETSVNISLSGSKSAIIIQGAFTATANGRFVVQWAQGTSDTDPTVVHSKSYLIMMKTT